MIDALIGGKIYGKPTARTSQSGKRFVTAKVRASLGESDSIFVNVIAFSAAVGEALLAMDDGDSVMLSGSLTPKAWTDKQGEARPAVDLIASVVTTAYHVSRKRKAVAGEEKAPGANGSDVGFPAEAGRLRAASLKPQSAARPSPISRPACQS